MPPPLYLVHRPFFQVGLAIFVTFVMALIAAQIGQSGQDSPLLQTFDILDKILTFFFLAELVVNMVRLLFHFVFLYVFLFLFLFLFIARREHGEVHTPFSMPL